MRLSERYEGTVGRRDIHYRILYKLGLFKELLRLIENTY